LNGFQNKGFCLEWGNHSLDLSTRTHIMGVINVTPDSFSDGGLYLQEDKAIEQGIAMARTGADIIDIGGESTRPYSEAVPCDKEMDRVIPVIEALNKAVKIPISIDTCKAKVAAEALKAGASMINDISALRFDPEMAKIAAGARVPVILMHMKGTPRDMQINPTYNDLIGEILAFLKDAIERAVKAGVGKDLIIIDPGIGFGKDLHHNLEIIRELRRFSSLGMPILLGPSRKAFIGHILQNKPHERDIGTMAAISAGILNGANIVRVHNVQMAVETVRIIDEIKKQGIRYEA
jgi:dihydropteroate synthase